MATTARFARPLLQESTASSNVHPLRGQRAGIVRDYSSDRRGGARREPAWLVDLSAQIDRSVEAIERFVARVGTMRESNGQLREMTSKLRSSLDAERAESGRRLLEQGQTMSREKRRTADAERNADALAGMLCDLERQLSVLRSERRLATDADGRRPASPFHRAD